LECLKLQHIAVPPAEEENIHPGLKAEAEGIVAALEHAGFQGLHDPGQLSKPGGKTTPFTLGGLWQSIWQAGSQGPTASAKEHAEGDGADAGEAGGESDAA